MKGNEAPAEAWAGSSEGPFLKIRLKEFMFYLDDEGKPLKDVWFLSAQAGCPVG